MKTASKYKLKEAATQKTIMAFLKTRGAIVLRLNSGKIKTDRGIWISLCEEGTPDVQALLPNGKTLFVETKSARGKLSASQVLKHQELAARGHPVIVARSLTEVQSWLDTDGKTLWD